MTTKIKKTIMIVCAEKSGDLLGSNLIESLKQENPNIDFNFIGVGGQAMINSGLKTIFPMQDIAVMGLFEVIPHLKVIMQRIKQTIEQAQINKIDALITIDGAEFSFKVAKKVKKLMDVPCIHYVSPQVWAWRENRVFKMAKFLDHVLALFPFEPKYYKQTSLKCTYVGHPVVERFKGLMPKTANKRLNKTIQIAILPGSRKNELHHLLTEMAKAVIQLKQKYTDIKFIVPIAEGFEQKDFDHYFNNTEYVSGDEKFEKLKKCDAAIACSGTANLELALLGVPMVIVYKMNKLTYKLAKLLVKVKYISPVNIVANKKAVPELIQDDFNANSIVKHITPLIKNSKKRDKMLSDLQAVRDKMQIKEDSASIKAAKVISKYLKG